MKVWVDGEILDGAQARIPVVDHGLLYGDGVFEGLRVYSGCVFRLSDHLRRLAFSAAYIGLDLPHSVEALARIVTETAQAYGAQEAYIRLIITRGDGELGVDPLRCLTPRCICIVAGISLYPDDKRHAGLDMVTVSMRKPPPDVLNPEVKSLNYLNSVMAKREARLRGADEGLILNLQGHVAEASVANVFMVVDGVLVTPPSVDGALPGITRKTVLELARNLGIPCMERSINPAELMRAQEVFLTGSGARMVGVARLDGVPIGTDERPVLARLDTAFVAFTRSEALRNSAQSAAIA